ncbi:hypothetical protein BEI02_15470 [Elizabethkingia sp. HvH-WGS333]|jgi:hypothetical protein|uniref:Uncharacterized protein n=2 Tax=Flavobacteriales TaxID=200644 RepID=A0A7Z7LYQ0_9FLAO|nr:hypothetical protein BEI02_15470 [Elizabethkingia sp. HvH-WGS333]STD11807.1 Uncharacterised protein [Elizabethkingia anophelis]
MVFGLMKIKYIMTEYYVIFEVLKIEQELEQGSKIRIGERFVGLYYPDNKEIYFTDDNGQEWIFYDGDTCSIISKI